MIAEGRTVFHKGAVISWARSIGVPDATAIRFMQKAGALVIDDNEPLTPVR